MGINPYYYGVYPIIIIFYVKLSHRSVEVLGSNFY